MNESPNAAEMERMLLWFKAQLPPHDLAGWYIAKQPVPEVIEDTTGYIRVPRSPGKWWIRGYALCGRCHRQFDIPGLGNATALDGDWIERTVEAMKKWVRRDAANAGPCWGDVPKPEDHSGWATLDAALTRIETP